MLEQEKQQASWVRPFEPNATIPDEPPKYPLPQPLGLLTNHSLETRGTEIYCIPGFKLGANPGSDSNASWDKDFNMRNTEREVNINYGQTFMFLYNYFCLNYEV